MSEEIKNTNTETVSKNFIEIEIDKDPEDMTMYRPDSHLSRTDICI